MNVLFRRISHRTAEIVGSPWSFVLALGVILAWAVTGPFFNFSDTWQLVINTSTTIITFLMVFLIQNTQNRDARVFQIKLDELIRAIAGARTGLVNLEEFSDADLMKLEEQFRVLRRKYGDTAAEELSAIEEEIARRDIPSNDLTGN